MLAQHAHEALIVAAHHPLRTGGPHGGFDHIFDFNSGTLTTSLASTSNSVNTGARGRYLMISGDGPAGGAGFYFGGTSIWEVDVDADVIPEPSSGLLAMLVSLYSGVEYYVRFAPKVLRQSGSSEAKRAQ